MDGEHKYKLITCVDPTKINVPIRDKFSKLTLSNKKKHQEILECSEGDRGPVKPVSRNLLEIMENATTRCFETENVCTNNYVSSAPTLSNLTDFSLMDEKSNNFITASGDLHGHIGVASTLSDIPHYVNPLLCSASSGSKVLEDNYVYPNNAIAAENTDDMQPLQVSDYNHTPHNTTSEYLQKYDISTLIKDVSEMAVSVEHITNIENNGITKETTLLVSAESQGMSCEFEHNRLQTCNINSVGKNQVPQNSEFSQSGCISLISTEDSCSAIIITDSSASEFMDVNLMTSDIPESGRLADVFLPNTFSNEKADRMEAFLRDVSQQRRELEANPEMKEDNFTFLKSTDLISPKKNRRANNAYKLHGGGLAYAATESMTSFATDLLDAKDHNKIHSVDRELTVHADSVVEKDTLSMSNIKTDEFSIDEISKENARTFKDDPRRLAQAETQINSSISQDQENNSIICSEKSYISNVSKVDFPEDSVIISETSSENLNSPSITNINCSSEEIITSDNCRPDTERNQTFPPQISVGNINISAKINIKISISQLDNLDDDNINNESSDGEDSNRVIEKNKSVTTNSLLSNYKVLDTPRSEQKQYRSGAKPSEYIANNNNEENSDEGEPDMHFLTHAERLLNEVYGKAWKTPDVIRTLKRTSRTPKKTDSTQSPQSTDKLSSFKDRESNSPNTLNTGVGNNLDKSVVESALDDFSIFRRDIVQTNLDSTRFMTPNPHKDQATTKVNHNYLMWEQNFTLPRTEVNKKCSAKRQQNIVRTAAERWRQLVDDDSDTSGDNASDDQTLDKTQSHDDSPIKNMENKSDEWSEISKTEKGPKRRDTKKNKKSQKSKRVDDSTRPRRGKANNKDDLIYLDLSKVEVTIHEGEVNSPLANNDANFNTHLEDILSTCKVTDKAKIPATSTTGAKSKRKLFTANFGEEDVDLTIGEGGVQPRTPVRRAQTSEEEKLTHDLERVTIKDDLGSFAIFNKHLEPIKRGQPVFNMTPTKSMDPQNQTKSAKILRERNKLTEQMFPTPKNKYGFLKSLDVCVAKSLCDPEALSYRENYRTKKEELAKLLYRLYNEKLFQNKLDVPLQWNKKLCNTAGRCLNKKKMGARTSVIELSEKVLTSADRLRCTLIHELCHAATWIFNGEGGHGSTWKQWALKANQVFPEIPKIGVCHQYDIEYKYTYKCTLCSAKSHAHSKSKKVESIRCSFCHGAIEIFLNKKDKDGNMLPTPVREPTGFAKFVKDNYKRCKRPDIKHADVMKILSTEFAALKLKE